MMAWRARVIPVIMERWKINKNLCDMRFSWEKVLLCGKNLRVWVD